MKLRVIDGGRKQLENRVIKSMMRGQVCAEDLDRLKPWGDLHLVGQPPSRETRLNDPIPPSTSEDTASR